MERERECLVEYADDDEVDVEVEPAPPFESSSEERRLLRLRAVGVPPL
jgi:hypothetical protein